MPKSRFIYKLIATGLGTGYLPIAPGTWGSAAVCAVYLAVAWATGGNAVAVSVAMGVLAVTCTLGCGWLGSFIEQTFGRKDPSQCSLDEWAGQAVALIALPLGPDWRSLFISVGAAFLAFRLFDIIKPPPARQLEKLPAGWGIVADDLAAGIYANIAAQLFLRFILPAIGL